MNLNTEVLRTAALQAEQAEREAEERRLLVNGASQYQYQYQYNVDPCLQHDCGIDSVCVPDDDATGPDDYTCEVTSTCQAVVPCPIDSCSPRECNGANGLCEIQSVQPDFFPCTDFLDSTANDECLNGVCIGYAPGSRRVAAIHITVIPAVGAPLADQVFRGTAEPPSASGLLPRDVLVAGYMRRTASPDGWFSVPSANVRTVAVANDWTWELPLLNNADRDAPWIHVFLVRKDTVVPVASGGRSLPAALSGNTLAGKSATRGAAALNSGFGTWVAKGGASTNPQTGQVTLNPTVNTQTNTLSGSGASFAAGIDFGVYVFQATAVFTLMPEGSFLLFEVFNPVNVNSITTLLHPSTPTDGLLNGEFTHTLHSPDVEFVNPPRANNAAYTVTAVMDWTSRTDVHYYLFEGAFTLATYSAAIDTAPMLQKTTISVPASRRLFTEPGSAATDGAVDGNQISVEFFVPNGTSANGTNANFTLTLDEFESDQTAVDCEMTQWSGWGNCSAPCGGGSQSRTRSEAVPPSNGGAACPINTFEFRSCNTQTCVQQDCSQAPDCAALNRDACLIATNTCGGCLGGFIGEPGAANTQCTGPAACGNGILDVGEECDDGNLVDGDGCTANCQVVDNRPVYRANWGNSATIHVPWVHFQITFPLSTTGVDVASLLADTSSIPATITLQSPASVSDSATVWVYRVELDDATQPTPISIGIPHHQPGVVPSVLYGGRVTVYYQPQIVEFSSATVLQGGTTASATTVVLATFAAAAPGVTPASFTLGVVSPPASGGTGGPATASITTVVGVSGTDNRQWLVTINVQQPLSGAAAGADLVLGFVLGSITPEAVVALPFAFTHQPPTAGIAFSGPTTSADTATPIAAHTRTITVDVTLDQPAVLATNALVVSLSPASAGTLLSQGSLAAVGVTGTQYALTFSVDPSADAAANRGPGLFSFAVRAGQSLILEPADTLPYRPPVPHLATVPSNAVVFSSPLLTFEAVFRTGANPNSVLVNGAAVDAEASDFDVTASNAATMLPSSVATSRALGGPDAAIAIDLAVSVTPLAPGTITVALPASVNANHASSVPASVELVYDPPQAAMTVVGGQSSQVAEIHVLVTFTHAVTGLATDDFVLTLATPSGNADTSRTLSMTTAMEYELVLFFAHGLPSGVMTLTLPDGGSVVSPPAFGASVVLAYQPPVPTLTFSTALLPSGAANGAVVREHQVTFTATFSHPVTGVTEATWAVTAAGLGATVSQSPQSSATATVWTLTVTFANRVNGAVSVDIVRAFPGVTPFNERALNGPIQFQYQPPMPTLSLAAGVSGTAQTGVQYTITTTFSSAVTNFAATDIAIAFGGTIERSAAGLQQIAPLVYTLQVTIQQPLVPGVITVSLAQDSGDIYPMNAAAAVSPSFTYAPPRPALTSNRGATGSTTHFPSVSYTALFSSAVAGVSASDFNIAVVPAGAGHSLSLSALGGGDVATAVDTTWVLDVVLHAPLVDVAVSAHIEEATGAIVDPNMASTPAGALVINYDAIAVTLTSAAAPVTHDASFVVVATFSSSVTGVTLSSFNIVVVGDPLSRSLTSLSSSPAGTVAEITFSGALGSAAHVVVSLADSTLGISPPTQGAGPLVVTMQPPPAPVLSVQGGIGSTFSSTVGFITTFAAPVTGVTVAGLSISSDPAGIVVPGSVVLVGAPNDGAGPTTGPDTQFTWSMQLSAAGSVTAVYLANSGESPAYPASNTASIFYRGSCTSGCDASPADSGAVCVHLNLGDGTCVNTLEGVRPPTCPPGSQACPGVDMREVEDDLSAIRCSDCAGFSAGPCKDAANACSDFVAFNDAGFGICADGSVKCNACGEAPCGSHGTCTNVADTFTCACNALYLGATCDTFDSCTAFDPCQNGGTCTSDNSDDGFTCDCAGTGFTGPACTVDIDDCADSPCGAHGTCTDIGTTFSCACGTGFTGDRCEVNVDECTGNTQCNNNGGACVDGDNTFSCLCPAGIGGAFCEDACPADPAKVVPGLCGCGVADTDSDNDNVPDCLDSCPNDASVTAPGACGCGSTTADSDNDLTPDCADECPQDPGKIVAGECGCGVADVHSDADGVADCVDACPLDSGKWTDAGACGCGVSDEDSNGDNVEDCFQVCVPNPCENGGTCAPVGVGATADFTCTCDAGWVGATCAVADGCGSCAGDSSGPCVHDNDGTCLPYYPDSATCPPGSTPCADSPPDEAEVDGVCSRCALGTSGPCKSPFGVCHDKQVEFGNEFCPAGTTACAVVTAASIASAKSDDRVGDVLGLFSFTMEAPADVEGDFELDAAQQVALRSVVAKALGMEEAAIQLAYQVPLVEPAGAIRVGISVVAANSDAMAAAAAAFAAAVADGSLAVQLQENGVNLPAAGAVSDLRGETVTRDTAANGGANGGNQESNDSQLGRDAGTAGDDDSSLPWLIPVIVVCAVAALCVVPAILIFVAVRRRRKMRRRSKVYSMRTMQVSEAASSPSMHAGRPSQAALLKSPESAWATADAMP